MQSVIAVLAARPGRNGLAPTVGDESICHLHDKMLLSYSHVGQDEITVVPIRELYS